MGACETAHPACAGVGQGASGYRAGARTLTPGLSKRVTFALDDRGFSRVEAF